MNPIDDFQFTLRMMELERVYVEKAQKKAEELSIVNLPRIKKSSFSRRITSHYLKVLEKKLAEEFPDQIYGPLIEITRGHRIRTFSMSLEDKLFDLMTPVQSE